MGRQPRVSHDLKERIPYMRFIEHFTVKEIERILGIKKTVVYDTLAIYRRSGVSYKPNVMRRSPGRQ